MGMGLTGPTLVIITKWLQISDAQMSYVRAGTAISTVVTALTIRFTFRVLGRDCGFIAGLLLFSATCLLTPVLKHYYVYFIKHQCLKFVFRVPLWVIRINRLTRD